MNKKQRNIIIALVMICIIGIILLGFIIQKSRTHEPIEPKITEMEVFNSNFKAYIGKQKGSTIKTLMQTVLSSNNANANQIEVDATDIDAIFQQPEDIIKQIEESSFYNVDFEYAESGFINKIIITNFKES